MLELDPESIVVEFVMVLGLKKMEVLTMMCPLCGEPALVLKETVCKVSYLDDERYDGNVEKVDVDLYSPVASLMYGLKMLKESTVNVEVFCLMCENEVLSEMDSRETATVMKLVASGGVLVGR
jgi:hypothetical protein